jgi:hypothetical protein
MEPWSGRNSDSHHPEEELVGIRIEVKCWIRIRIKVNIQKLKIVPWMAVDAHNGGLEAQMELWRV